MAFTPVQMGVVVAFLGIVSFIVGVIAEIKKPPAGEAIKGRGVVICKYPYDPTVVLGYISVIFLSASSTFGYYSLFYPYKNRFVPQSEFFCNRWSSSFFNVALATAGWALAFLLWPTIGEQILHTNNIQYSNLDSDCPTVKTGLFGGGAFLSLSAMLFWLVSLMLANNVREDYFEEISLNSRGNI